MQEVVKKGRCGNAGAPEKEMGGAAAPTKIATILTICDRIMISDPDRPPLRANQSHLFTPQQSEARPLLLDNILEEVLRRVLTFVASDFKSLARLCYASRRWLLLAANDMIWHAMFLARWAAPVSLAESPNIPDRSQMMTIVATESIRKIDISSGCSVLAADVLWKTLFRDCTALAWLLYRRKGRLKLGNSRRIRGICIDAYSIVTAPNDGIQIWDCATQNYVWTPRRFRERSFQCCLTQRHNCGQHS
ncbi:hypothetical protein DFJ73DRAFT_783619 [Zopfochytrium polystomum]|nr:hypothetical protein DFJ73DRAFT_783619 [Zopfochytrium polystomum]